MAKLLIVGAGGVGRVAAFKCAAMGEVFSEINLASRTVSKCEKIAADIGNPNIKSYGVDADDVGQMTDLLHKLKPDMVLNLALPYQDLPIMDACLNAGVHYIDTANYEPPDEAKFEYKWQWEYQEKFKAKGLMALLGSGFDPGVTNVFTAYASKHYFDEMHQLDIIDCNAGDHGKPFATNFNPEINIREVTQNGRYFKNGQWLEIPPHSIKADINYPEIGPKPSYLIYHEELESLVKNFPSLKQARFWMTFSENYLTHLRVIQNIGMASIETVNYEGKEIVPLQFLKAVLPNPGDLGDNYKGYTSIGCRIKGIKNGQDVSYYVYNNCSHEIAFKETGTQAVSYTTGVPAAIGAMMLARKDWLKPGVFNMEQLDPDPFMAELPKWGLPWNEKHNIDLEMPDA